MRRPLVAVYLHLIWVTWDRPPLLGPAIDRAVHRAIQAKACELGAEPLAIGDTLDHVHFLVGMPATLTVADLVGGIKGASTHLVTHELLPGGFFKWQGAYGAFSVGPRQLDRAREYIARQREHHATEAQAVEWERQVFAIVDPTGTAITDS